MRVVLLLMIFLVVFSFTACKESTPIETEEQAADEVLDIGDDVDDVGALLDDIDSDLG